MFRIMRVVREISYLILLMLVFICIYARIGCTLFSGATDAVLDHTVSNYNFDSLWNSTVVLWQLWVGEGWHDLMCKTIIYF